MQHTGYYENTGIGGEVNYFPEIRLEKLIQSIESGSRPQGGASDLKDGIPSFGGEHITRDGTIVFDPPRFIPESYFNKMKRGQVQIDDILIVKDGATTGKTAIVTNNFPFERAAINEHVFIIRLRKKFVLPAFMSYFLQSSFGQSQIMRSFQGAAIGG
ncbi:MAG: hypothetical protein ACOYMG_22570, partial [Candidatus Methylumidiphilus sp.]